MTKIMNILYSQIYMEGAIIQIGINYIYIYVYIYKDNNLEYNELKFYMINGAKTTTWVPQFLVNDVDIRRC